VACKPAFTGDDHAGGLYRGVRLQRSTNDIVRLLNPARPQLPPALARPAKGRGSTGLWTTPSDLLRFAINLQRSLAGQSEGILKPKTARAMLTPTNKGAWSMGFRVGGGHKHPYFLHGGSNAGFRSLLAGFDTGDGIAIMTNGDAGREIASAILRTVAAEYHWPRSSRAVITSCA